MAPKKMKSFAERTVVRREKCIVRGCDGHVDREYRPMLMTPDDQTEVYGRDWTERFPQKPLKGAPKDALVCSTRGTADVTIMGTCAEAVQYAETLDRPIAFEFNGDVVVARKGDDPDKLWRAWWKRVYKETYEQSMKNR